jgi:hypothetical protein
MTAGHACAIMRAARKPCAVRVYGPTAIVHLMGTPPSPGDGAKTEFDLLGALFSPAGGPTRR